MNIYESGRIIVNLRLIYTRHIKHEIEFEVEITMGEMCK